MLDDFESLYKAIVSSPRFVVRPSGRRVLVLAPHPDDEVIGCGGTLCKHVQAGDQVTVVYITDGSRGGPDGRADETLPLVRRVEAEEGLSALGIRDHWFLGLPDQNLKADAEACAALSDILRRVEPDLIYLPHLYDRHCDHVATNLLLAAVLASSEQLPEMIAGYEVWGAVRPTLLVNVTDQMATKQRAIRAHRSQIKLYDYPTLIDVLGRYRVAVHHPTQDTFRVVVEERRIQKRAGMPCTIPWTHLEAFRALTPAQYLSEVESVVRHARAHYMCG